MQLLKYDLDRKSLTRFYVAYIRSILEYVNVFLDNCTKAQSDLLESINLDKDKIIIGLRRGTSHTRNLDGVLCLKDEKNSKGIQLYKILNNESPSYLDDILLKYN